MHMTLLMYCWILSANILLRIFLSMTVKNIGLWCVCVCVCVCVLSVSGFDIRWPHRWVWECTSSILGDNLRRIDVNCLYVWKNSPVKMSGPGHLFAESFLNYWFNFITGNWSVHIFYLFLIWCLKIVHFKKDCTFLEIYLLLLGCPFYWHIIVPCNLRWSFVFLWCQL